MACPLLCFMAVRVAGVARVGMPHLDARAGRPGAWELGGIGAGVLVAFVKLSQMADIEFSLAFYAFVALIVLSSAANAALDPREVWKRLEVRP